MWSTPDNYDEFVAYLAGSGSSDVRGPHDRGWWSKVAIKSMKMSKATGFRWAKKAIAEGVLREDENGLFYVSPQGVRLPGIQGFIPVVVNFGSYDSEMGPSILRCEWSGGTKARFQLPAELQRIKENLVSAKRAEAESRGAPFFDGILCRLDQLSYNNLADKTRKEVVLRCSETTYFDYQASNYSLERDLAPRRTIRTEYALDPSDYEGSKLSNVLSVNLAVRCSDDALVFSRREMGLNEYPNTRHAAAAGKINLVRRPEPDLSSDGRPDIFKATAHEAHEELGLLSEDIEQVVFFGLVRDLIHYNPELIGVIKVKCTSTELNQIWAHRATDKEAKSLEAFYLRDEISMDDFVKAVQVEPYPIFSVRAKKVMTWVPAGHILAFWCLVRELGWLKAGERLKRHS